MAGPNIEKMPLKDLIELESRVKKAIVQAKERERAELKQKMVELAEESGFSVSELFGSGRGGIKGGKVAVKYRNRENPSETWTGRGRQPKWLSAALKKGAKLQDFAV
ncbi:MAG TPA: H-NS histone family protein [Hyphomicrobiaceae bacterium]|nr:H-NS histone family protein [Hyphomicrobiaceae bacterium]